MKDFYLTLLSDSSVNTFPNNKQCSFTVRLNHTIQLKKENWEVALTEIITPSEILNISDQNNFFFLTFIDQLLLNRIGMRRMKEICNTDAADHCPEYKLSISKGNYSSPQHLVEEIQTAIDTNHGDLLRKVHSTISISYGKTSKRIKVSAENSKQVRIRFPPSLGETLGLDPELFGTPIGNEKHAFKYEPELNTNYSQMYVYSDVASFTFIGDVQAPILRVVPFKTTKEFNHQEFLNLHYVPVAKSFIDEIYINIKGDNGEDIPFITGKTLIKLHFRQSQN